MKYMIMMIGDPTTMMEVKSIEWIKNMIEFMGTINDELAEAGELVAGEGLVDPSEATTIRFQNGAPVPTDGPFAEAKESLAGYWIIEAGEERVREIGSRIVAFTEEPLEIRQVADAPPDVSQL